MKAWWGRWPFANVGVPTGRKSDLLVLDVNPGDGGLGDLKELERAGVKAPKTANEWVDRSVAARPAWLVGLLAERLGEQTLF